MVICSAFSAEDVCAEEREVGYINRFSSALYHSFSASFEEEEDKKDVSLSCECCPTRKDSFIQYLLQLRTGREKGTICFPSVNSSENVCFFFVQ